MTKYTRTILQCLAIGAAFVLLNGCGKPTPPAQPSAAKGQNGTTEKAHDLAVPVSAANCAKHGIPASRCAFCDPSLVQKLGFCAEHDVAEAWCTRCTPILIAAFKKEGDWCAEHGLPKSQDDICKATDAAQAKPG